MVLVSTGYLPVRFRKRFRKALIRKKFWMPSQLGKHIAPKDAATMWAFLQALIENCSVAIEYSDKSWRFAATGPIGVFGLIIICSVLLFRSRRRSKRPSSRTRSGDRDLLSARSDSARVVREFFERFWIRKPGEDAKRVQGTNPEESPFLWPDRRAAA